VTRAAALITALALAACSHRDAKPPPPSDTVAPVLAARPAGGTFTQVQYLVLSASEPSTIRYTLDGTDPALASNTSVRVGESPIFWIRIGPGTTVVRAIGMDAAWNVSAPLLETYAVSIPPPASPPPPPELAPPTLTLVAAPDAGIPLLASATIDWKSDQGVSWDAWFITTPSQAPRPAGTGSAAAGETVSTPVNGWDLQAPAVLRVTARDAAGWITTLEVPISPAPPVLGSTVASQTSCNDLAFAPDGSSAYFTTLTGVAVLDANPASSTFDGILATHALPGPAAESLAVDPAGARLWVGSVDNFAALFSMDAASGATTVAWQYGQVMDAVAVTSDGSSIFISDASSNQVMRLTVDAGGTVSFGHWLPRRPYDARAGAGSLALAASGRRLFVGTMLIDADPASTTRDQQVGSLPVAARSQPAPSPGDGPVFLVSYSGGTYLMDAFDPMTLASVGETTLAAGSTGPAWQLAVTPDGSHVLALEDSGLAGVFLHALRASDLVELGRWTLPRSPGASRWSPLRITPDGTRAYVVVYDNAGSPYCQPMRVPLR
jgi:hypothetical protein